MNGTETETGVAVESQVGTETGAEIGAGWPAGVDAVNPDMQQILRQLPHLERRARTLARNQADAADLVQDTLEKALRALPRLRPGSNVAAWLETLLSHTFIDRRRWAARRLNWISVGQVDVPTPEEEAPPPWMEISDARVRAAVERLPPGFAAIFRLHAFGHLRYSEIAKRLGIPSGTVGTRLRRARQRLKLILLTEAVDCPPTPITARTTRRASASQAGRARLAPAARAARAA